jgi:ATP-dependent Clp protease, protease subunit
MSPLGFGDEVRGRLYAARTISIVGHLDDSRATAAAAELWTLDASGDGPITALMSLSGGTVRAALALIDAFDIVGVDLRAVCLGAIVGPPVAAYAAAATRLAGPNARFVLREEWREFSGSASELDLAARHADEEYRQLAARLADATKGRRSVGDILLDFEQGRSLGATEGLDYGIVDALLADDERIDPPPRRGPLGFSAG